MPDTLVTLGAIRVAGIARLAAGGIEAPAREARQICDELAGAAAAMLRFDSDVGLSARDAERLESAFERRAGGEPLAYVVGRIGFRHLDLRVDRRVLIPRPETEGLVERVLVRAGSGTIADIGTGSGCIALSLAMEGQYDSVLAIDSSRDALDVAAANGAATGSGIGLIRADLLESLGTGTLDALVSNPPYLSDSEYAALDRGVRDWEPAAALASGPAGLDATLRLLREGRRVVKPGGWLALEVDCRRAAEAAFAAAALGWSDVVVESDLFGRERYLLARRSAAS